MSEHTPAHEPAAGETSDTATITCPRCGAEKPAGGQAPDGWIPTPPGSTMLTTVGMARKAAGGDGEHCACGRRRLDGSPG